MKFPINRQFSFNFNRQAAVWFFIPIGLFVISFAATYFYFSRVSIVNPDGSGKTANNKPGDQVCPLNGAKYSKEDQAKWEARRPLAVMIENHVEARPQAGLNKADVVYEAVAEGGITRFMAIFYCQDADLVGPVRSARTYFLDWASEYDALYAHVGGASQPGSADAMAQIQKYGLKDMDQFSLGYPTYWRDDELIKNGVPIEHTMFSTTAKLWDAAVKKHNWTATDPSSNKKWDENFQYWTYSEDAPANLRGATGSASVPFWDKGPGDYRVEWTYDKSTNLYKRAEGGIDHIDKVTKEQLAAKNVVIQLMTEKHAGDGYPGDVHLLYTNTGSGKAIVLQNGKVIQATWKKADRLARTKYYDAAGKEISFVRGLIWIQTVPTYNEADISIK